MHDVKSTTLVKTKNRQCNTRIGQMGCEVLEVQKIFQFGHGFFFQIHWFLAVLTPFNVSKFYLGILFSA